MSRQRLRAEAKVIADNKQEGAVRSQVPRAGLTLLEARLGDALVFEEGSTFVAEAAAAKGKYLVVRLERREPAESMPVTDDPPAGPEARPRPEPAPELATPELEPLDQVVRRRLSGQRG